MLIIEDLACAIDQEQQCCHIGTFRNVLAVVHNRNTTYYSLHNISLFIELEKGGD